MAALVDLGKWANTFESEWNSNFNAGGNATDSDSSEDESEDRQALAQQVARMMQHHKENDEKKRQKKLGQKRKAYLEDLAERIEKSEEREKRCDGGRLSRAPILAPLLTSFALPPRREFIQAARSVCEEADQRGGPRQGFCVGRGPTDFGFAHCAQARDRRAQGRAAGAREHDSTGAPRADAREDPLELGIDTDARSSVELSRRSLGTEPLENCKD